MSYARMTVYPGESSSVSQEESARGRPRLHWEVEVKEDAAKLGCRNWTVIALNQEGWRKLKKEAKALGCSAVGMDDMVC